MQIEETPIEGLLVIQPDVYGDERGFFFEGYQKERYAAAGMPEFVQDNVSRSRRGVLRGLHFQIEHPQGKLVSVLRGEVFDAAVDLRPASSTFGRWFGLVLNDRNHRQLYIPPEFGHGFAVLSAEADFMYKCTAYYRPDDEGGIIWNDPDLAVDWPVAQPSLSDKDRQWPRLKDLAASDLPGGRGRGA